MKKFSLQMLEAYLNSDEYPTVYVEQSDEVLFPTLVIFLGLDKKGQERKLEIVLKEQQSLPGGGEENVETSHQFTLQFRYVFPFQPDDMTLVDTVRLVTYLNYNFEVPGLELDEVNNLIQYRYVAFGMMDQPNLESISSIIGVIVMFVELFNDAIEQVATGKTTMNDLLERALLAMESAVIE